MPGLFKIALKLLVNDQGKFFTLIIGLSFSVFLMMQMTAMFAGILKESAAQIINVGAPLWIMDPAVQTPQSSIPIPAYLLDAVRSIPGVRFAAPLYEGGGLAKLADGSYQAVNIVGLDDATLYGRPALQQGNIADIYGNDAFFVARDANYVKLENPQVGGSFQLNDHRVVIAGIADIPNSGLFGTPTLYTTFSRATQDLPSTRFQISYILAEPKPGADIPAIERAVARTGYLALTDQEFITRNDDYFTYHTGMGANILIMTLMSFIVGLSIAGQTFYMFVLDNLEHFGALKAIGARGTDLVRMIVVQAAVVALLGYGIGVLLSSLIIAFSKLRIPNYAAIVTWQTMAFALVMVVIITLVSSYIGIRKVIRIEPFEVFRG